MGSKTVAFLLLAPWLTAATATAQFQSCIYCDVQPFNPDPLVITACDSGISTLMGVGFQSTGVNGCAVTPAVTVRSSRPDRLTILSFQVLSDTAIEITWMSPCTASPGLVGIDVRIDDDPGDGIDAYACGNARVEIVTVVLAVTFDRLQAKRTSDGNALMWQTSFEDGTAYFEVRARRGDGVERSLRELLPARGAGHIYRLRDTHPEASETVAYQILEHTWDGRSGDTSGWLVVTGAASGAPTGQEERATSGRLR